MNPNKSEAFQEMLSQLRHAFLEDVKEKLDRIEQLLLEMEIKGASGEPFNELYRIVHSLKGGGGTFGLYIITTICHQFENLLNETGGGAKFTPALMAVSLDYADLLRAAVRQIHAGDTGFSKIEERLQALHRRLMRKQHMVLIVEGSRLWSQIYLQALAELPVRPVVADDGYAALMRALTEPFDLLITANEIPVLNGVALIGALKLSTSKNRNIPAILVTANQGIAARRNRATDADYVIARDASLAQNLAAAAKTALAATGSICGALA
jgi:CheY-like chemotaxis protein